MTYRDLYNTKRTPQNQRIPGRDMVKNRAGGWGFKVGDWKQLERFLILGTEKPTYYASEREMTIENAEVVQRCLREDGKRTVDTIVQISESGRAPKNEHALFALAMASSAVFADTPTRKYAFKNLSKVARTGTHLFHFVNYREGFGGWGRLLREAIANWYLDKDIARMGFQMVKYRQRDGWSHKDLLRLAHPKPPDTPTSNLFAWAVGKDYNWQFLPNIVRAYTDVHDEPDISIAEVVDQIDTYGLTRGMLPTQFLNIPDVWKALLPKMGMEEMVRNLGKMGSIGVLKEFSETEYMVLEKLENAKVIQESRLHPIAILKAMLVYKRGHGVKGSLSWPVNGRVLDSLDSAFYTAFDNVRPTGKRFLIAIDTSGSMSWPGTTVGDFGAMPMTLAGAMSLAVANVEKNSMFIGFDYHVHELDFSPRNRLDDVVNTLIRYQGGGTDCSLPIRHLINRGIKVDAIVVYTDNETWRGHIHPVQALQEYRHLMGTDTKMISVAMTATEYSVADASDPGMLDVVGFDTSVPEIISNFVRGEI